MVSVERDRWQFLQSQSRVVSCLSNLPQSNVSVASVSAQTLEEESIQETEGAKYYEQTQSQ